MPRARVTVYCGSQFGTHPAYAAAADQLADALCQADLGLVYGGSRIGLMGRLADRVLQLGGEVIGIMPTQLIERELQHPGLSRFEQVANMAERKQRLLDLGDALVAMPGGLGTFEEWFEAWSWARIGLHTKPMGLLDTEGYYQPLWQMAAHSVAQGFTHESMLAGIKITADPVELLQQLGI